MNAEAEVTALYNRLIDAWNSHNAADFAAQFAIESRVIGFDGSQMNSQTEIKAELSRIFADHVTAPYVTKVRDVRLLTPDVAILQAVVGMIPPGQKDINPATNAIQTLVAHQVNGQWRIVSFQNTPAQFHGRPELVEALTSELQALL